MKVTLKRRNVRIGVSSERRNVHLIVSYRIGWSDKSAIISVIVPGKKCLDYRDKPPGYRLPTTDYRLPITDKLPPLVAIARP